MIKCIILAAGKGSRMGYLTMDAPKALVKFNSKSIISYQMEILEHLGITNIVIIRGYLKEKFEFPNILYYDDIDGFNMVHSLFKAIEELNGDVIISYGDIIYSEEVILKLLNCKKSICVVYDTHWESIYSERFSNPHIEAESFILGANNQILEIGTANPPKKNIHGQFIGLIKLTKEGAKTFKEFYLKSRRKFSNSIFIRGRKFENIFMTDFLQALIDNDFKVYGCPIENGWLEFDSQSDLNIYENLLKEGRLDGYINLNGR